MGKQITIYNVHQHVKFPSKKRLRDCLKRMLSFGLIRICDQSSLGSRYIKWTKETFPRVDLSVPLMCCGPSDLWSLILIWLISMERTLQGNVAVGFYCDEQAPFSLQFLTLFSMFLFTESRFVLQGHQNPLNSGWRTERSNNNSLASRLKVDPREVLVTPNGKDINNSIAPL